MWHPTPDMMLPKENKKEGETDFHTKTKFHIHIGQSKILSMQISKTAEKEEMCSLNNCATVCWLGC